MLANRDKIELAKDRTIHQDSRNQVNWIMNSRSAVVGRNPKAMMHKGMCGMDSNFNFTQLRWGVVT